MGCNAGCFVNVLDSNIWREAFVYDVKRDSKGAIKAYFIRFLGWSKKWDRVVFSKLLEEEMKEGMLGLGVEHFRPWGTEVYEWRRKVGIGSIVEVRGKNVGRVRVCVCVDVCVCVHVGVKIKPQNLLRSKNANNPPPLTRVFPASHRPPL
jgi:hypothetical protein